MSVIPKLKQKTIVLVHTEALRDQWIAEIEDKLGLPKDQVGIIQANKNTSEGKPITISLIQTLARRDISTGIFDDFGFVILDECHKITSEFFNDIIAKFPARYRLALTATPKKKDGSDIVLRLHFGEVSVLGETEVMPVKVYAHKRVTENIWGDKTRVIISSLRKSKTRNAILVKHIAKAYNNGRNVLGVSGSVDHIQTLIKMLQEHIPAEDIGQLTATRKVGKKPVKVTQKEQEIAKTKRVILATDGLVREGLDIPRLDMGIDLEPFYNATQRIGRVRRFIENKPAPYWITLVDTNIPDCYKLYRFRLSDYKNDGLEVVEYEGS